MYGKCDICGNEGAHQARLLHTYDVWMCDECSNELQRESFYEKDCDELASLTHKYESERKRFENGFSDNFPTMPDVHHILGRLFSAAKAWVTERKNIKDAEREAADKKREEERVKAQGWEHKKVKPVPPEGRIVEENQVPCQDRTKEEQ